MTSDVLWVLLVVVCVVGLVRYELRERRAACLDRTLRNSSVKWAADRGGADLYGEQP